MSASDQSEVTQVVVNLGKALGAYQRQLTCGKGRFDEWIAGDDEALTESEQRGAYLFVGKAGCVSCHSGPYFSDERFHNVGLKPAVVATVFLDAWDEGAAIGIAEASADPLNSSGDFSDGDDGRLSDVGGEELLGAFRTPRLRCASSRPAFMHTGQFGTLDEVVAFFNRGGDPTGYPGVNELQALDLTLEERADLVAFLATLEGPGPSPALLGPP
jgi:cytochrome c peroxidase